MKSPISTRDYTIPQFVDNPSAALAFYAERGFHIERNIWSAIEQAEINLEADAMPTGLDGTFLPVMNCHRESPRFLKALKNMRILKIMEQLLGGRVSGLQSEYFLVNRALKASRCTKIISLWSVRRICLVQHGLRWLTLIRGVED